MGEIRDAMKASDNITELAKMETIFNALLNTKRAWKPYLEKLYVISSDGVVSGGNMQSTTSG